MKTRFVLIPFLLLVLAALACGSGGSPALYRDNFSKSDSGWCSDSTADSSLDYEASEYVFQITKEDWFVWCNPEENFENIHVEVTAKNVNKTSDTVFGLMCHYQPASGEFYYLGISSQGDYTIRRYQNGADEVLAEDTSEDIAPNAEAYTLGADCANGKLTLYVDGKEIASTEDSTFTSGDIGLFGWTSNEVPADIRYDDIVVTKINGN